MTTRIRKPKSASSETPPAAIATPAPAPALNKIPPPPVEIAATSTAPPGPLAAPLVYLDPPPADANIPAPPEGFVAGNSADFRNILPRDTELRALPIAVKDLGKFTSYTKTLGNTAPPYAQVVQAFTVANEWSAMRTRTSKWDAFCASQEEIAWTTLRALLPRLQTSFELATTGGASLSTLFPGLQTFLGAKKVIARKGASTRRLNAAAEAEGKQPHHGGVGKQRKKAAEKAAYEVVTTPATPAPTTTVPSVQHAPQVAPVQPAASPTPGATSAPAPAAPATGTANGATNGVPHS